MQPKYMGTEMLFCLLLQLCALGYFYGKSMFRGLLSFSYYHKLAL